MCACMLSLGPVSIMIFVTDKKRQHSVVMKMANFMWDL